MKELKITFNQSYEDDKIKLLYEECQQQAYDFYEQAQINHLYAQPTFKEYANNRKDTFINKVITLIIHLSINFSNALPNFSSIFRKHIDRVSIRPVV